MFASGLSCERALQALGVALDKEQQQWKPIVYRPASSSQVCLMKFTSFDGWCCAAPVILVILQLCLKKLSSTPVGFLRVSLSLKCQFQCDNVGILLSGLVVVCPIEVFHEFQCKSKTLGCGKKLKTF